MNLKKDYPGGNPVRYPARGICCRKGGKPESPYRPNPDSPNRTMRHFDVQPIGGIVFASGKDC